ncbi:MAG: diguanylate cyclase [Spirochaetes bacterium]|nr:diguanylate cyclase [Spirochaetota bacterium]
MKRKIKRVIIDFITSGMLKDYPTEILRRIIMVNLMCSIGIICFSLYAVIAFFSGKYLISAIDSVIFIFMAVVLFCLRKTKNYTASGFMTAIIIGLVLVFYVYAGWYRETALMWTFVFPLIAYFIFGTYCGTVMLCIFFSLVMSIVVLSNFYEMNTVYTVKTAFRYVTSFFVVSVIAYCFEYIRKKVQMELIEKNEQLERNAGKLEKLNKILNRQATTDKLTCLCNRRRFNEIFLLEWNRALRSSSELSLLICDLDYFKKFNDTYGHPEGDFLLRQIALIFKRNMERPGDFAARIGGEEFAVILEKTGRSGAEIVAERIRRDIEDLCIEHMKSVKYKIVTISIGVSSCIPDRRKSRQRLMKAADAALYKSKAAGRNRVTYLDYNKPVRTGKIKVNETASVK